MNKTMRNGRGGLAPALLLVMIAAAGLMLGGCDSDATAPQDPAPVLSEGDAAAQAGLVAMAVVQVGPEVINYAEVGKTVYERNFVGDVSGTVFLDFRLGGADGASATWMTGNWVRLYTGTEAPLVITIGEAGGSAELGLDINATLNRVAGTAVVGGGGTFATGPYAATFTFDELAVASEGYPSGGSMTFTGGGFVMTVAFDGTNIATVTVEGHGTWFVNLDTGAVSQAV